jgi:hypothetical protein
MGTFVQKVPCAPTGIRGKSAEGRGSEGYGLWAGGRVMGYGPEAGLWVIGYGLLVIDYLFLFLCS